MAVLVCVPLSLARADDAASPVEPATTEAGAVQLSAHARVATASEADALGSGELEALRTGLGDNFNPTDALPGTLQLFSGVPYLMVRGAPPAASAQYLDGVPVPALFHLALGPAITHPSLLGAIEFYPGVAPARYGRHTGAVLEARGKPARAAGSRSEVELRVLDAQGLALQPGVGLGAHARVGYPDAMLALLGSQAQLGYWDYHARWSAELTERDRIEIAVFGAADRVGTREQPDDDIELEFHRGLVRLRRVLPGLELGGHVIAGYERGRLGTELTARATRLGPALWLESTADPHVRLRLGADLEAKVAHLRRRTRAEREITSPMDGQDIPSTMPGTDGVPQLEPDTAAFLDRAPLARVAPRTAFGAYAEFEIGSTETLELTGGVRGDVWFAAGHSQQALDPRLRVRARVAPMLNVHAGLGRTHQAAASPLPIPGLTDYELDTGLQSALQSELGTRLSLPWELQLDATAFYHAFSQLVFVELIVDCEGNSDPSQAGAVFESEGRAVPLCARNGLPRGAGRAYGLELWLSRSAGSGLRGWLSYTLSHAAATAADGTTFVPQFDVRHVLNLVLAQPLGAGLESGLRLHFRSGKPASNTVFDFARGNLQRLQTRLPGFLRLDLSLAYHHAMRWGGLWITLQFLNVTFAREATKRDCRFDEALAVRCELDYQPAVVLPNVGVRASF